MKNDYDYQLPWRTNFEAWAIVGWLSGIGLALLSFRLSGLPIKPFLYLAGFCGFMALWRLPSAVGVWYRKHRLRRFRFEYRALRKQSFI